MRYADSNTPTHRFPDHIQQLLRAMVINRRTFSETDTDPPFVTDAIRYESRKQKRIKTHEGPIENGTLKQINKMFDFESPLGFQLEAWDRISEIIQEQDLGTSAALVTAPTGFGKTEAFLGPLLEGLANKELENIALVYPRTALLRDQLSRVLKAVHHLNNERGCELSVGPYYGDIPFYDWQVDSHYSLVNKYTGELKIMECWCGEDDANPPSFELDGNKDDYTVTCNGPNQHTFDADELILSKERMTKNPPNIFVTTLQSLETSCLKPNYSILDSLDAIVVDEIHLYQGIYGSHASRIFRNIRRIKQEQEGAAPLFIGSSATLDSPERFAQKMFDVSRDEVESFRPKKNRDFKPEEEVEDYENYYFILSSEDASLASTFTQQSMLLGHSLLQPSNQDRRNKMLSFIDSISSVNQKSIQFTDADRNRQLWRYHLGYNDEDWEAVANAMGNDFIDEPLNVDTDHSETTLTSSRIADSEMLISTATLEVGIDLDNVNIVTQYHAPFDLSNFVQRAGRAGRQNGDSHIVTFLARDDGDKNLFNRADRFLDENVTTPLNPDNTIVEWVHDSLYAYYVISSSLDQNQTERDFMKALFCGPDGTDLSMEESIEYGAFFEFLQQPQKYVSELLETGVQNLFNPRPVESLQKSLASRRETMQSEIEPIARELRSDLSEFLNSGDPSGAVLSELRNRAHSAVDEYQERVTNITQVYEESSKTRELQEELGELETDLEQQTLNSGMSLLNEYRKHQANLREIDNQTVQLCFTLGGDQRELTYDIGSKSLTNFEELLNAIAKGPEERLKEFRDEWQATYYLKECLKHLEEYHETGGTSHESAHAVKYLLRSLYFFDRYLHKRDQIHDLNEQPDVPIYYVPENYFGSSGSTFTLVEHVDNPDEETGRKMSEQPLFSLFSQYYPYRTHFNQSGEMEVYQPPTIITDSGLEFDFTEDQMQARREAGYLRPDAVPLKEVADCSGNSGQMILNYCPRCYEILNHLGETCPRHDESSQGKLFSEPQISGKIIEESEHLTSVDEGLSIGDFTMKLQLEAVEITEHEYVFDGESFFPLGKDYRTEETIALPEGQQIGIQLDTRGLIWEFDSESNAEWIGEVLNQLNVLRDSQEPLDIEAASDLRRHTAAHLLTLIVADVAGVKTDTVRYHINDESNRIIIYEQAEGGQGIVDLAVEELQGNPAKFLDSLLRVSYDPAIINRQCWASNQFLDQLDSKLSDIPLISLELEQMKDIVEDTLNEGLQTQFIANEFDLLNEELYENIAQEALSYVDKLDSIREDTIGDISDDVLIDVGHQAATAVLTGQKPSERINVQSGDSLPKDAINNLLGLPSPDGCINTLHIQNCTGDRGSTNQSDCLSHILLQTLRQELISTSDNSELYEQIDNTKTLPATTNSDGTYRYISF